VNGAENGAEQAKKSDERSGGVSGSRKNERGARSGRSRSGSGAVNGLNLRPLSFVVSFLENRCGYPHKLYLARR